MIGYRYGTWSAPRASSAGDVVRFEQDELGNDLGVDTALLPVLDALPASALLWITTSKCAAHRYRTVLYEQLQVWELPHALVIGEDGDGGYLIIRDARNLTQH